jgi:hypothetical protein
MPSVELNDQEWQQVINILATAPWAQANPLLMRIGGQLQGQRPAPPFDPGRDAGAFASMDGKGARS